MNKTILIKNNKGGVGKSWITLQIAHGLSLITDKKVLILTSDSQNNILNYSGISCDYNKGLEDWLELGVGEKINIRESLQFIPLTCDFIKKIHQEKFDNFIQKLKNEYEYILIDSSPVLTLDKCFMDIADEIIIPTFLDNVTTHSIFNMLEKIDKNKIAAIIPNKFSRTKIEKLFYTELSNTFKNTNILLTVPVAQSAFIGALIDRGKTIWETRNKALKDTTQVFIDIVEILI
ncbi:MAG: ParA family protein [Fusobacteriaceae bacterium]